MLAVTGWSLANGLSNLLIDGALEGLPIPLGKPQNLARQLALQAPGVSAPPVPPPQPSVPKTVG